MSDDRVILGIHSQVGGNYEGNSAQRGLQELTDGHAWISVTRNGQTQVYGLWPDDHPRFAGQDSAGSDIRTGVETGPGFRPNASRYYELTPEQVRTLEARIAGNETWAYSNTCASWASDTVHAVTGQRVQGSELLGFTDTPRKLIESINELERQRDTTPTNPLRPDEIRRSSSFGALTPDDLPHAERTLYANAEHAVARDLPGAGPNVAANLAVLAHQNGMGIDHVVPGTQGNVFIVQGALDDPAHRRAVMPLQQAEGREAGMAVAQLAALGNEATQRENAERLARGVETPAAPRLSA